MLQRLQYLYLSTTLLSSIWKQTRPSSVRSIHWSIQGKTLFSNEEEQLPENRYHLFSSASYLHAFGGKYELSEHVFCPGKKRITPVSVIRIHTSDISSDWDSSHQNLLSTFAKLHLYKAEPQVDKCQLMAQYYTLINNIVLSFTQSVLPQAAFGVIYFQLFGESKMLTCPLTNRDAKIGKERKWTQPCHKASLLCCFTTEPGGLISRLSPVLTQKNDRQWLTWEV